MEPFFNTSEQNNFHLEISPNVASEHLYILWNIGESAEILVDEKKYVLKRNCMIFISEFHMSLSGTFAKVKLIEFEKSFLGLDNSMNQAGDYLLIFYGYHFLDAIPKIQLNEEQESEFTRVWENIEEECMQKTAVAKKLIQNSFQRLMLLAQKAHAKTEFDLPLEGDQLRIIRAFQYLVETNFKTLNKVADYAQILKVPAKKLTELFKKHYHSSPSELIAHRRNLFAQKQLLHSKHLVKNIAIELNFADSQSFSHFFKKHNGVTPEQFRSVSE
ncbi:MAG: helix-turn-helix domain-containing protein [Flavobacteriales bacterium]